MNLCIFGGSFVRKPELKHVGPDNTPVTNFSIAVNRKFKKRNSDEMQKEVTYINCEAWDSGAETIVRNCNKGDYIVIYASAKSDTWKDKETGQNRSGVKFRVDRFEFVPGVKRHTEDEEPSGVGEPQNENEGKDVEIPF
jgi:single-strand DNA-binding protein